MRSRGYAFATMAASIDFWIRPYSFARIIVGEQFHLAVNKTVSVTPAQRQKSKPAIMTGLAMVVLVAQVFCFFASVALVRTFIDNQEFGFFPPGKFSKFTGNATGNLIEQLAPVMANLTEQSIKSIQACIPELL